MHLTRAAFLCVAMTALSAGTHGVVWAQEEDDSVAEDNEEAAAPEAEEQEGWIDEEEKPATKPDASTKPDAAAKTTDAATPPFTPPATPAVKKNGDSTPNPVPDPTRAAAAGTIVMRPAGTQPAAAATAGAQPATPSSTQTAAAQSAAQAAAALRTRDIPTEAELERSIEARARYLRSGDQANAEVELGSMIETRLALGARNVVLASASLIHEANAARSRGNIERAIQLAETASRLSPDLTPAHWLRARLYYEQNGLAIDRVAGALADIVTAKLGRFRNSVALLSNILTGIFLAIMATIVAFTAIQILKHIRYPGHDLSRMLPSWFGTGEGVMLLSIIIAAPLVFGYGAPLTIALALGAIYAYQSTRERVVSMVAMVLLGVMPGIIYLAAPLVTFHGSITDAMETAISEAFAGDAEQRLLEFTRSTGRSDLDSSLVLAHRYRMRGDIASAELEYRRALQYQPSNAVARNNLGTLLYYLGREEAALATFQAAGASRPEPLLNQASILLDQSKFDDAKVAIERARKLDPELTEHYTRYDSSVSTADKLLYAEVGGSGLWSRLFEAEEKRRDEVTLELWRTFGGAMPPLGMPAFVLLIAALAAALAKRSDHLGLSTGCPKCGVPAGRDSPSMYCEQCQSIFLKAIAVDPMLRIAKEEDVHSYQRNRRWLERGLSVIAGAGHIFSGRPIAGVMLFLALALALAAMRFADGFIVHPWSVGFDPAAASFQTIAAALVAVLLLVVSVRSAFK